MPASLPNKCGLIVGKFCPLHRGHEYLIETARAQCQSLWIISYNRPEFSGYEVPRRARWLQARFPDIPALVINDELLAAEAAKRGLAQVPRIPSESDSEHAHRLFCAWLCLDLLQYPVDVVFTSEDYGDGFAQVLSQEKQKRHPQAESVRHICVDKARKQLPISGTALRADPHAQRRFLSAEVYADFVQRLCFLGAESCGKTTLAELMAQQFNTRWVPEYGRELWLQRGGKLRYPDMAHIGHRQVQHEDEAAQHAARYLFCDTSALTTLFYSQAMFGQAEASLQQLATRRYHHIFLCAPDFPFIQDGTRKDEAFRQQQHAWYVKELQGRGIAYTLLEGSLEQRVERVKSQLVNLKKQTL